MRRTRVKICGIRRVDDALVAVRAGADALGLVFHRDSPRAVSLEEAAAVCAALPPFVVAVGLFVDASADAVHEVLERVPLGLLQFHGDEGPEFCGSFGRPWVKAVRMRPDVDVAGLTARYGGGRLLLDAYRPGVAGGTGECFDWQRVPAALADRVVLAGGLTPANVGAAIAAVRPWAVDVSGGVESQRGVKDAARIEAFLAAVQRADQPE